MPRPKEFEPSKALDQAMKLFWQGGVAGTSLDKLVDQTGASRYGLYSTFGGKEGLLEDAVRRYQEVVEPLFAPLDRPNTSLPDVHAFLDRLMKFHERSRADGCLVCNVAFEIGQHGSPAADRVRLHFSRIHRLLLRALGNARARGELPRGLDAARHAEFLVSVVTGSFLLARAGMPRGWVMTLLRSAGATLAESP